LTRKKKNNTNENPREKLMRLMQFPSLNITDSKKKGQKKDYSKHVAIYTRVSTEEQAEQGESLETQEIVLKELIKNDPDLPEEYTLYTDPGRSAKNMKRPGLQKLFNDIQLGNIDIVLVLKLDRLTRKLKDLIKITEFFENHKVALIAKNDKIDTSDAMGRFFNVLLGSLSQLEREQTGERTYIVKKKQVKEKCLGGRIPYGYIYNQGSLIPDPDTMKIVKEIYNLYQKKYSLNSIARKLSQDGYLTPNELNLKRQGKNANKNGKKWTDRTIKSILRNPVYTGRRLWNRYENRTHTIRDPEDWIIIEDAHPKIISETTYQRVQTYLNRNIRLSSNNQLNQLAKLHKQREQYVLV
jgi:site-specific DNA recombinase